MENYDRTMELIETAQDSAGRSSEQFAKYADSVENKVNKLKNTWEQFRVNLIDEKTVKKFLDTVNLALAKFSKINLSLILGIGVWGLTIGKNFILGIIKGLRLSSNLLATAVENLKAKITTGSTKILLLTNLNEINALIDLLKIKLSEISFDKNVSWISDFSGTINDIDLLETELNKLGLTIDGTRTDLEFLDFTTDNYENSLKLLVTAGRLTEQEMEALSRVLKNNKDALLLANNGAVELRLKLNLLGTEATNTAKNLQSAKSWGIAGNAIGSALGTAAMMAFTGTFGADLIAKTVSILLLSTGVMTAINATTAAMGRSAGMTFGAAFTQASGWIGLLLASLSALYLALSPIIEKWVEDWKYHHDLVYKAKKDYEAVVEESKKLSELLDELNLKLEAIEDKWKNVNSASNTFEELNRKISLSEEEQLKLNEATLTLAEEMPSLVSYYDAEGNAVIEINESYKEKIKLLKLEVIELEKIAALTNTQLLNSKYNEIVKGKELVEAVLKKYLLGNRVRRRSDLGPIDYTVENILLNINDFEWKERNTILGYSGDNYFDEALTNAINRVKKTAYTVKQALEEVWIGISESDREKIKEIFYDEYLDVLVANEEITEELKNYYLEYDKATQELVKAQVESLQTNYSVAIKEALLKVDDNERRDLIESVLKNIYLNPDDIKKAYENALAKDDNGKLDDLEMKALLDSLIDLDAINEAIKEIENLTPELYEVVTNFYDLLSALTLEEQLKAINAVSPGAEKVAMNMKKYALQTFINIRQMTDKYVGNYGINDLLLIYTLLKNSSSVIENVLEKASEIADKYGSNNGERYITAFNEAVATGSLNEAAKTYLNSIDWSTFDFIHEEELKELIVNTLVETYKVAENEARKIVNNFLNTAGKENLGFVVELRTEADVVAIQQSAEKAYEILQDSMDSFTVLYNLEPNLDSVELTRELYEKVANAIKQLNEAEDSPYHINLSDYLGIDGKTFSNIAKFKEELQAPLKGTIELNAKLTELLQKRESGTLTDAEKGMLEALKIAVPSLRNMNLYMSEFAENAKEAATTFKDITNSISSIASDYLSITEEQEENGFLSSSALKGLTENINSLNEQLNNTSLKGLQLDITSILSRNEKGYYANTEALKAYIIHLIAAARASGDFNAELQRELQSILDDINAYDLKRLEEAQKAAEEEREKRLEELKKAAEEALKAEEDAQKAAEDAAEDAQKALEEITKAEDALKSALDKVKEIYKDIEEKQQKVIEQQEKLNELMYGTGSSRKSTLDGMYNYDLLLKLIENDLENVNAILEHPTSTDDIGGAVAQYGQLIHGKKVNLLSLQSIYQLSLTSAKSALSEYSAYYTEINGRLLVDVAKLNSAAMPDKVKDLIESTISAYNDSVDKIHEITSLIKLLENEFLNFQRTYRDKYINLQEKVIETLKSLALEELNTTKEKYSALEEADNDYITALEEAIKKQRELRLQEQDINELSLKEKKLSLLQRDTSGTRKKDVLKLQKEVEKARLSITDKSIDNLINSLKELYKDLKESRDAETKYMETVLENATYIEEANAVISSWQTADDMIAWFFDHSTEVNEMTLEQLEQYSEELEEMYNAREIYMNTSMEDFTKMLEVQEEEIVNTTTETAEHLTSEAQRAFAEVMKEVDKAIGEAKKDLADAMTAVDEAKQLLLDALNEVTGKLKDVETAKINAANAAKLQAQAEKDLTDAIEKRKAAEAIVVEEESKPITNTTTNTGSGSSGSNSYLTINNNVNNAVNLAAEVIATVPATGTGTNAVAKNSVEVDKLIDNFNKMDKDLSLSYTISKHIPDGWETKEYLNYIKKRLKDPLMLTVDNTDKPTKFKVFDSSTNAYPSGGVKDWRIYKKGGLVNYTGPAWVDGTPANPEAFLSAEDTRNIARLTDVLGSLYSSLNNFNTPSAAVSNNNTVINVSVNVDGISSDYDVDRAVEKVKQSIVDAANQVGSTVILYQ